MITGIDAERFVIKRIKVNKPIISGIIADRRPINSTKEDIIVNHLPFTFEQLQEGVVNVNVYVPNLEVQMNGVKDTEYPNYNRLNEITKQVIIEIDDFYEDNILITVQQAKIIEDKAFSYMNIRVAVASKNLK
ncbi:Uncharacterised protein [Sphingobacterium multivorum]|uniref:hypothetical protein n=1 Tax=Sphingobacterium multivorum TaxID=28454 RepID=UPI000DFDF4B0|nr:hypothetical protein [Sphingobacterium multivorum]QQT43353.1 hypothetical protein I6J00_16535 [Sphingobacterium multivorum]SUI98468.1 Uncharacterised protein [Sphingobacterium multivorum]